MPGGRLGMAHGRQQPPALPPRSPSAAAPRLSPDPAMAVEIKSSSSSSSIDLTRHSARVRHECWVLAREVPSWFHPCFKDANQNVPPPHPIMPPMQPRQHSEVALHHGTGGSVLISSGSWTRAASTNLGAETRRGAGTEGAVRHSGSV